MTIHRFAAVRCCKMMDVDGIIPMDYLTVLSDKVEMVSRRIQKTSILPQKTA